MQPFVIPPEPLRIALIGAGQRSRTVYAPLFLALEPWVKVVAVCDPVRQHADALAERLGVAAFYSIHDLVKARPMEAALVVTPVPSHHSISIYLSSHGIHNLAETTWCSLIAQAKDMITTAERNKVVVRVGENFFRFPIDRMAQGLKASKFIGEIRRVFSYNDHTGYHNNSRWIAFAGAHPTSIQSVEHTMTTAEFWSTPERFHTDETYRGRFITFPDGLMVIDQASNIKGFLGRHSRPGYNEWQGERGTLVYATIPGKGWEGAAEVRYCSDQALAAFGGQHDQAFQIVSENEDGKWKRIYVDLPTGHLEYANPFDAPGDPGHSNRAWYGIPVAEHVVDFALAARGLRKSEFSPQDAMMSLMMEIGAHESALHDGKRIALPLEGEPEADRLSRENLRKQFGADPMDVEGMLAISYPKP
jgi:predicted dehydrogenase